MFAYCLNNPVNGCDPCGTCFHRLDFWNDCEACGGRTIGDKWNNGISRIAYHNGQQRDIQDNIAKHQRQIISSGINTAMSSYSHQVELQNKINSVQTQVLWGGVGATYNAYMRGYSIQQEAQRRETQMMLDRFSTPQKTIQTLAIVGAELSFIGCFWGGKLLVSIGAGIQFIAAVTDGLLE